MKEIAEAAQVSVSKVKADQRRGKLKVLRIGERAVRVEPTEALRYLGVTA